MLEESLGAAYDLLDAYHIDRGWDRLSFGRSAIEPHEQDKTAVPNIPSLMDFRAYGEGADRSTRLARPMVVARCDAISKQIALHLLAIDDFRTDFKIGWLLDRSLLYELELKHGPTAVLQAACGEASKQFLEVQYWPPCRLGPVTSPTMRPIGSFN